MFSQADPSLDDFYSTKDSTVDLKDRPVEELDTLDEPVWKTIGRDFLQIGYKLTHVIFPMRGAFSRIKELKDWDLWGPLLLCLILAVILTFSTKDHDQQALLFGGVFVIVWAGSAVITVNAILLGTHKNNFPKYASYALSGGRINFFQSVCVLGYCLGPLDIGALVILLASFVWDNLWFRIAVVLACFIWSILGTYDYFLFILSLLTWSSIIITISLLGFRCGDVARKAQGAHSVGSVSCNPILFDHRMACTDGARLSEREREREGEIHKRGDSRNLERRVERAREIWVYIQNKL